MTQLALRGVVRDAIRRVIREDGLPGSHHFYITFLTRFPGVDVDESLAKKYSDEITIVLEHQYWDLKANDDTFEVTLKFNGVPKFLSVPYTAVTRFHDPSVGFALQFDPPVQMQDAPSEIARIAPASPALAPAPKAAPAAKKKAKKSSPKAAVKAETKAEKPVAADGDGESKVVSLDSFRKK
ncbi:MAG: ClpXP protease specificity-enhancing factor SspB [Robiginitomaculum sp.]